MLDGGWNERGEGQGASRNWLAKSSARSCADGSSVAMMVVVSGDMVGGKENDEEEWRAAPPLKIRSLSVCMERLGGPQGWKRSFTEMRLSLETVRY